MRPIIPDVGIVDRFWNGKPVPPLTGWMDRYREVRGLDEREVAARK